MKILTSPDFLPTVENSNILLDTTVFIDASLNPTRFGEFFNELKKHGVTLFTLDLVIVEFLRGSQNEKRFIEKKAFVENIIETCLPVTDKINKTAIELTREYLSEGKGISTTDFLLASTLVNYPNKLFLMTRNTNDFSSDIFELANCFNIIHKRGIFAYGLYKFAPDK